jgi:hypothetical protein
MVMLHVGVRPVVVLQGAKECRRVRRWSAADGKIRLGSAKETRERPENPLPIIPGALAGHGLNPKKPGDSPHPPVLPPTRTHRPSRRPFPHPTTRRVGSPPSSQQLEL